MNILISFGINYLLKNLLLWEKLHSYHLGDLGSNVG